ncbi:N-acetylgalactosamine-N, N'-diacetylbacillosaminyl-diphospho-undecaprenol 4-alpha-N-acetylgalactosaminyltransferase [Vibrio ruber DSM 16370]|uniref:N-acetylgalactosamine-N, N'-diacetylbacillosaminyl-diphospho-undecaprenol 4-alpha-N-acetylgalactosaminyltransferase n=1 Tax=Vibrio ruber (strain DSM 16370 / JCM 11486 / BCRC 17186 / CECT 7878 / LMG 23124 / VR1) TaxID=1123498 RepID=A0A1R4LBK1_VIBR1|nr:glycosyltransferase [Vibrio ruber]SJN53946.1 N-acetylgalactosamine-N, N'-diacetylbacillosaminyl-diphospho-undecaprenol 4-alpha-N-acetylgalactosaminyltransferase [Vibrio ruber DSM 16370]
MRIIFRISYMGFGGAEQVFLSVARTLMHEHEVLFVTDRSDGSSYTTLLHENIPVRSLDVKRTFMSLVRFKRVIDDFKPDVILSAYPDTNAACLLSASMARHPAKVVVSEHASIIEHFQHKPALTRLKVRLIVQWLYRLADQVVAVSEGVMNDIVPLVKRADKCCFIHNPVRFNQAAPAFDSQQVQQPDDGLQRETDEGTLAATGCVTNCVTKTILAVGRVTPQKDYMTLLRAVRDLIETQHQHDIQVMIVGGTHDKAEMSRLTEYIDQHQLQSYITFVGFSEQVERYYAQADLFVLSSAWEGFGNVIVEALAFGVPVVSTDCRSGPAEILQGGQFGRLVSVGDSSALAKAMSDELATPSCSRAARLARAAQFSEREVSERYKTLFEALV